MYIPNHKIKAAVVFVLAIGLGIGLPLLGRIQGRDIVASVTQPGQNPSESSTQQASPAQQGTLECSASPATVYVGDTVTWQIKTINIANPENLSFIWSGAVIGRGQIITWNYAKAGTYSAKVQFRDPELGSGEADCAVNVTEKSASGSNPGTGSDTTQGSTQGGTATSPTPAASSTDPAAAPDILSCKIINPTLYVTENKISIMRCTLKSPALVTARIVKGDYLPPSDPDPASIIKTLVFEKTIRDQIFSFNWNGIDSYDSPVADGPYTFVVSARETAEAKADISIHKLLVMVTPPVTTQEQTAGTQPPSTQEQTPVPDDTVQPDSSTDGNKTKTPEASKCPDVNYPTDIENHWATEAIRKAYDECIFRGYPDGTFRPEQTITRAEAVKAVLIAAGISPKLGCYDTDCGTPFQDLLVWQSQWLRAAWDLKIVRGITDKLFVPQRPITRGEAMVFIAKAFRIEPYKNCFTPNCGAGQPDNFFLDITDPVQGSYIRALWELGVIKGTGPNTIDPDRPITRAEIAALIMKM